MTDIPKVIRAQPAASSLMVVDERVPLAPLIKALADAGFTVINDRTGKLIVTYWPEDFRATVTNDIAPSNTVPMRHTRNEHTK